MVGWLHDRSFDVAAGRPQEERLSAPMRHWLDKQRPAPPPSTASAALRPSPVVPAVQVLLARQPPACPPAQPPAVVVSLTECRAACRPLLDELAAKYGWRTASRDEEADVLFTDIKRAGKRRCFKLVEEGRQRRLLSLLALQSSSSLPVCPFPPRVNCFPGMADCVSKCSLSRCLSFHQRLFPSEYDYFPVTYDLGSAAGLRDATAYLSASSGSRVLIVKPSRGSQGAGIVLCQHVHQLQAVLYSNPDKRFVAQQYIDAPCLLGKLKFDLRVYVLVTSLSPLTVHVFQDGLARLCTEPYRPPNAVNLNHTLSHLSNYSLNKHSFAFKPPTENQGQPSTTPTACLPLSAPSPSASVRCASAPFSASPSIDLNDDANKRSIGAALSQLAYQGTPVDVRRFWADINEIAEKTVLALTPSLWSSYSAAFQSAANEPTLGSACFHLLGFDCLLDERHKVWLLEVNSAPSMATDSALDWRIKMSVWEKSLHILGIPSSAPANQQAGADEPLSFRSVSSVSSSASSTSSCASVLSRSSSASASRPSSSLARSAIGLHSASRPQPNIHSARALRSNIIRRPTSSQSGCSGHSSNHNQRPPLQFAIPTFDWRDMRHTTATAAVSSYSHLHSALCHPQLLALYHHFAHPSGGLTPATFRRIIALFTSSASWCTPLPAGDAHLLFLQQTKLRGGLVVPFDGFCACLATIRQRHEHGTVLSDRQEAVVWEEWSSAAYQRFVAYVAKANLSFFTSASAATPARRLK